MSADDARPRFRPSSRELFHCAEAGSTRVEPSAVGEHGLLIETRTQIWLDGAPPHRFRLLETSLFRAKQPNGQPAPSAPTEVGGHLGAADGLSYDGTAKALDPSPFAQPVTVTDIDPVALIKDALRHGHAMPAGKARIDGRPAIKIILAATAVGRTRTIGAYYVDPATYRPLRIVLDQTGPFGYVPGFPIPALALIQMETMPAANGRYTFDFSAYRNLAAM